MSRFAALRRPPVRRAVIAGAAVLMSATYLVLASAGYGPGFPLDDAWIHQTYARNLVDLGQWAFIPGQPSSGSTSPLWTLLQAGGHVLAAPPPLWSALLGGALLVGLGWMASAWWAQKAGETGAAAALVGVLVVTEWHLVWAALSGMEILAFTALAFGTLWSLDRPEVHWARVGVLIGLGLWIRPDALSLLIPALWVLAARRAAAPDRARRGAALALGAVGLAAPYLALHLSLSGSVWPTTFYAKQTEYQILTQAPLVGRLGQQFVQPLVGLGAVLLPGLAIWAFKRLRRRDWCGLAPLVWSAAFLSAYAVRLPVTYQHGRYAMPVIPVVLLLGCLGMLDWVRPSAARSFHRVLSRVWILTALATAAGFAVLGARALATDVAIIQTEMVGTARWVEANTEPDALVAGHDIGALGYFGGRRIIDLAGLVSPEVIPILRDEAALAEFLDRRGADYLVTFPSWYPRLAARAKPVFFTDAAPAPAAGGENMGVYRW